MRLDGAAKMSSPGGWHQIEGKSDALRMISGSLNIGAGLEYARLKISIYPASARDVVADPGTCVALHKVSYVGICRTGI